MSAFRTLKTVLWSFIGIRKKSEYEADLGQANPLQIVAVALVAVAVFVAGLAALVPWVVKN